MKRSALLLVTTAGMILAGAGVTEIIGDASADGPPVKFLADQHFVTDSPGVIQALACTRTDSGYGDR
ncbi:hypothetical protein ACWDUL_30890 [Nocardia niigatensis]|uniref:hypothetical protein n=1 Tax=Nocardia niigatensis TaxID=209249 RepID=UPI0002EBDB72|nr:hypothetical protein [Nocardia niigatensis]